MLYAPGLRTTGEIRAVCDAVSKPVNVLALPGLTLAEIVDGRSAAHQRRRRRSPGSRRKALVDAATAIRDSGDFSVLSARNPL